MEARFARYVAVRMVIVAVAVGGALTAALYPVAGAAVASTAGIGFGVGFAVYADRRWLRPSASPLRQALEYGVATAAGWALAQIITAYIL